MKKLLFIPLVFILSWSTNLKAQIYQDDFESYTVGGYLAVQNPDWWTTWSESPGSDEDAVISDEQAHSGTKSVMDSGINDEVLLLGNKTSGNYNINWWMYIPSGYGGYFNILHVFDPITPTYEWAMECYLRTDGTGRLIGGFSGSIYFDYPKDVWFLVENNINMDEDSARLYIDGTLIATWQFSLASGGGSGTAQLAAVDFYAGVESGSGETPLYYFDDLDYFEIFPVEADFEADNTMPCVNDPVQFTDLSSDFVTQWEWTFPGGDPPTSDEQNPVVVYYAPGEYDVTLWVSDGNSTDEITKTDYIQVQMDEFPDMSLSPDTLDFDTIYIETVKPDSVQISNACADTLWVTNVVSDNADYTVDVTDFYLPPNTSYYLVVQFMPLIPGYSEGVLTIYNNDPDTPEANITLMGYGMGFPIADITPDNLAQELHPDQTALDEVNISNNGTDNLIYTSSITYETGGQPGGPRDDDQWLSIDSHASDTITPGTGLNMEIGFDAAGLTPGNYSAEIVIESNDLVNPVWTIPVDLTVTPYPEQTIDLPAGWGSVSGYLVPLDNQVEVMFEDVVSDLTILMNMSQVYWPGQGINTIITWNTHQGYKIRMENAAQLVMVGDYEEDKTLNLNAGWNIIPLLNNAPVSTTDLFGPLGDTVIIIKEIAGTLIYWPGQFLFTLENLDPGKAYMIALNEACSVTFPPYVDGYVNSHTAGITGQNITPWNDVDFTAASHNIAIDKEALSQINPGDVIGVFNATDLCCGMIKISDTKSNACLTAFGDDFTTPDRIDGLMENETMFFRLFRPASGEEYLLNVQFDASLPDQGTFATNGLSKINSFAMLATGIENHPDGGNIHIYPNPSAGQFHLLLNGMGGTVDISIWDMKGQLIKQEKIAVNSDKQHIIMDLSFYPRGIYTMKIMGADFVDYSRIIRH
jgi:PKD repeat protein